jgi:hypothetical protein
MSVWNIQEEVCWQDLNKLILNIAGSNAVNKLLAYMRKILFINLVSTRWGQPV